MVTTQGAGGGGVGSGLGAGLLPPHPSNGQGNLFYYLDIHHTTDLLSYSEEGVSGPVKDGLGYLQKILLFVYHKLAQNPHAILPDKTSPCDITRRPQTPNRTVSQLLQEFGAFPRHRTCSEQLSPFNRT